jgi:hypothetical protein
MEDPILLTVGETRFEIALVDVLTEGPLAVNKIDRARLVVSRAVGGMGVVLDVSLGDGLTLQTGLAIVELDQETADALPVGTFVLGINLHHIDRGWTHTPYGHVTIQRAVAETYEAD